MTRRRIWIAAALAVLCVAFGATWWFVTTGVRPTAGEPGLIAVSRVQFLLALPLRILAMFIFGARYFRHAHEVILLLAFLTPLFWFLVLFAANRLRKRLVPVKSLANRLEPQVSRRVFLSTAAVGTVGLGASAMGTDSLLLAPQRVQVRSYAFGVPWLPDGLDSLRIAHVSDTHLGPFISRRFLEGVMEQVNEHQPDLVFLTGDYVHRHPSFIGDAIGLLEMLQPRIGTVAVLGNHDHWEGADACRAAFARTGIPLLDQHRVFLTARGLSETMPSGEGLCIAGVGDLWEDTVDFGAVLGDVPWEMQRLVLSHNPDTALMTNRERVDIMFAGHTHGGQVVLPVAGVPVSVSRHGDRFQGGLCEGNGFPVIVSRGIGLAGIPVRFRVPPEFGIITLTRSDNATPRLGFGAPVE